MIVGGLQRYSTDAVAPSRRLAFWNDLAARAFGSLTVDSSDRGRFEARLSQIQVGGFDFISAWSMPAVVHSSDIHSSNPDDAMRLIFQLQGVNRTIHCGKEVHLAPGDLTLLDPGRPFVTAFNEPIETLVVRFTRVRLGDRLQRLEPHIGAHISGSVGAGIMLSSFLRGMWSCAARRFDSDWETTVSSVLLGLLDIAVQSNAETAGPQSVSATHRDNALAYIERRLSDPELSAADVAKNVGISMRYLQMLFAPLGTTPSKYILQRRLEIAADRLRRQTGRSRVATVAYSLGFNDLSYFCRAFRRRFDARPSSFLGAPNVQDH